MKAQIENNKWKTPGRYSRPNETAKKKIRNSKKVYRRAEKMQRDEQKVDLIGKIEKR